MLELRSLDKGPIKRSLVKPNVAITTGVCKAVVDDALHKLGDLRDIVGDPGERGRGLDAKAGHIVHKRILPVRCQLAENGWIGDRVLQLCVSQCQARGVPGKEERVPGCPT